MSTEHLDSGDIAGSVPPADRIVRGPVAIIECSERIPCDPCVDSCKVGAIRKTGLVDPPVVDYEKCTGCRACISRCPGLAVFVIDSTFSPYEALVVLPYEMYPVPKVGDTVIALDREGKSRGDARVISVAKQGGTNIVAVAVEKNSAMIVRNIEVRR